MPNHNHTLFTKDFTLLAIGQIISLFGNQILRYALPLYLLTQTGSSALFGTVTALSFLPMLLFFPLGGILADRLNKRNIMVALDFGTALLVLLFSLLAGRLAVVPLLAVTLILLYGIQGAYQPAVKASVPALLAEAQMLRGNSLVDLISSLSGMAGPVLGGILFSLFGLMPILYVSMGCFLASALLELFLQIPHQKQQAQGNILRTGFGDLRQSFRFMLREQPALWQFSLVLATINLLLTTLVLIGLPVIVTQHLGFAAATANRLYGYAQGLLAAGCVLGGLLAGLLSNKLKLKTSPLILLGCALSVLLGGLSLQLLQGALAVYLLLVASCGLLLTLSTLLQIQVMTYLQILTPPALVGKVISCVLCVCMCTNPLGQFAYGLIFERLGSGSLHLPFYGAALLMCGVVIASRPVFRGVDRQLKRERSLAPVPEASH